MAISAATQKAIDRANAAGYSPGDDVNRLLAAGLSGSAPSSDSPGYSKFRQTNVTNTPVAVKASSGNVYGWNVVNLNSGEIFVKLFNAATGSITPGTTPPATTLLIPANGSIVYTDATFPLNFGTAISVLVTTVGADTGAQTAAAILPIIELWYK